MLCFWGNLKLITLGSQTVKTSELSSGNKSSGVHRIHATRGITRECWDVSFCEAITCQILVKNSRRYPPLCVCTRCKKNIKQKTLSSHRDETHFKLLGSSLGHTKFMKDADGFSGKQILTSSSQMREMMLSWSSLKAMSSQWLSTLQQGLMPSHGR